MIKVSNCGHDSKHKTKFHIIRKTGVANYILLLVKTEAFFELNGTIQVTNPNMAILFDRNTFMHYGSYKDYYNDDWIHFDFTNEPSLIETLKIPLNQPVYLPQINYLSNFVRMLVQENHTASPHREPLQDSIMRILLYNLDTQIASLPTNMGNNKYSQLMNRLRLDIHNTPHRKWTVKEMAASVHMSTSYFQHLYKELYHLPCMQEVIMARIERAKFYLTTTDMSLKALSDFCGYESDLHFIRQFKKKEGLTPTEYRNLYKNIQID